MNQPPTPYVLFSIKSTDISTVIVLLFIFDQLDFCKKKKLQQKKNYDATPAECKRIINHRAAE